MKKHSTLLEKSTQNARAVPSKLETLPPPPTSEELDRVALAELHEQIDGAPDEQLFLAEIPGADHDKVSITAGEIRRRLSDPEDLTAKYIRVFHSDDPLRDEELSRQSDEDERARYLQLLEPYADDQQLWVADAYGATLQNVGELREVINHADWRFFLAQGHQGFRILSSDPNYDPLLWLRKYEQEREEGIFAAVTSVEERRQRRDAVQKKIDACVTDLVRLKFSRGTSLTMPKENAKQLVYTMPPEDFDDLDIVSTSVIDV